MAAKLKAKDVNGRTISVGDQIAVRCSVVSVNGANPATETFIGAGETITVTVSVNGNVGDVSGVTFTIGPNQAQLSEALSQITGN
jgi:hypothetical protein